MNTGCKLALSLLLVGTLLLSSVPEEAAAIPYRIEGYLRDSEGLPITLANISLSGYVFDSELQTYIDASLYTLTDANGYYRFVVGAMEPGGFDMNSVVTVAFTRDGLTASRDITIQGLVQWANLTYEGKVGILDSLLSPIGLVLIVALVFTVMIGIYMLRPAREDSGKKDEPEAKRVERRRKQR